MMAQNPSAPPSPPAVPAPAPAAPGTPGAPFPVQVGPGAAGPSEIYQALRAQRRELMQQLENLEDKRRDLSQELQEPMVGGADRKGLEARISEIDQRITGVDKEIAATEAQIARAAGVPGAIVPDPPRPRRDGPPEEFFVLGGIFIVVVLGPLSIAYARRLWRRGAAAVAALPKELSERLTRLEQAMDAVAVEVERIGEGQRFMSRFLTEDAAQRAIGAGAAEPIQVKSREGAEIHRR